MLIRFTKMHGLGNDYLYVLGNPDFAEQRYGISAADLSIRLSDRHFGVGSDGMIWIGPSNEADFFMRIFNADGSEAMMCGNGVRCVGKYVYDKGLVEQPHVRVETLSGVKELALSVGADGRAESASVEMGAVAVGNELLLDVAECAAALPAAAVAALGSALREGGRLRCLPVSVGNPHAVVFVKDAEGVPLESLGPAIERHAAFPDGVNAEFVQVVGENELRMRVWERGSGITMACGTGTCASAAAAVREGLAAAGRPVTVHLDGGMLRIDVAADGTVVMTGPAATVCEGEVEL